MYDRNIIGTSSEIFGFLRQSLENFRKMFGDVRQAFGTILENLRKFSESGRKSSESRHKRRLYNKQNNTWTLGDMEFILSCSHSINKDKDKFHISERQCIILYLSRVTKHISSDIIYVTEIVSWQKVKIKKDTSVFTKHINDGTT